MNNSWIRQKPVDILNYLPFFLSKDNRFKSINAADSVEHEKIRLEVQELLQQLFIDTATWGLQLWEEFCGIVPDTTQDYKTRRSKILAILNGKQTVTLEFIRYLVNRYVADDTGNILPHYEQYYIDIMLPDGKVTSFEELEKMLRIYMPAHLGWHYLAYVQQNSNIYAGGITNKASYVNIPADTGYNISINGPCEPTVPVIVCVGTEITIPADLYV